MLTGSVLGNTTDTIGYNSFGAPALYQAAYNGACILSINYTRNDLGRIVQKNETIDGETHSYAYMYDQAGRLTNVSREGVMVSQYHFDANENRLSYTGSNGTISGTYDDQDRLMQYGTTSYTYTANGELLSKTLGAQTTSYQYDVLGNLMKVSLPDGTKIVYMVDGINRRIGKRVNGTLAQGFLYEDDLHPIAELDGSNNIVSRFVYATQANVPDYMVKGSVVYRIFADHLGSPRLVINASTGEVVQRMDYDEFGNIILDSNPGFQPFGFAGGLYDRDTKLVRFGARDYDAEIGHWTVKDPSGFVNPGTNLYAYVSNDPLNLRDPTGEGELDPKPVIPDTEQLERQRAAWARCDALDLRRTNAMKMRFVTANAPGGMEGSTCATRRDQESPYSRELDYWNRLISYLNTKTVECWRNTNHPIHQESERKSEEVIRKLKDEARDGGYGDNWFQAWPSSGSGGTKA
jgi:RHS repeat-associated protein